MRTPTAAERSNCLPGINGKGRHSRHKELSEQTGWHPRTWQKFGMMEYWGQEMQLQVKGRTGQSYVSRREQIGTRRTPRADGG